MAATYKSVNPDDYKSVNLDEPVQFSGPFGVAPDTDVASDSSLFDRMGYQKIPYSQKYRHPKVGEQGVQPDEKTGESYIIDAAQRPTVLPTFGGKPVPFYNTTGKGGKKEIEVGSWHPFFGFGKSGWMNKTHGSDMAKSYGSKQFAGISAHLNNLFGNRVGDKTLPLASAGEPVHEDAINAGLLEEPMAHADDAEGYPRLKRNIQSTKEHLAKTHLQASRTRLFHASNQLAKSGGVGMMSFRMDSFSPTDVDGMTAEALRNDAIARDMATRGNFTFDNLKERPK